MSWIGDLYTNGKIKSLYNNINDMLRAENDSIKVFSSILWSISSKCFFSQLWLCLYSVCSLNWRFGCNLLEYQFLFIFLVCLERSHSNNEKYQGFLITIHSNSSKTYAWRLFVKIWRAEGSVYSLKRMIFLSLRKRQETWENQLSFLRN